MPHSQLTYAVRVQVLIVDGANVVGSRPDGWWRDRAGAARRLQEQLSTGALPHDAIVEAVIAQLDIGDGRGVTVVTADRVLRDRVEAAGARSVGPSWLLDQL